MARNHIIRLHSAEILRYLEMGMTHYEVSTKLEGITAKQVYDYAIWHNIDIVANYRLRIERAGIHNRLCVSDSFANWFTGFFDGEGCLLAMNTRDKHGHRARIIRIHISQRADDPVLDYICKTLGVGKVYASSQGKGNQGPRRSYQVNRIDDIAEVIIPLFDRYPLVSRKSKEYPYWRELAVERYILTLGGYSTCCPCSDTDALFDKNIEQITQLRRKYYKE
jgi:hypothetical protein